MFIKDIMTTSVCTVGRDATLREAARLMADQDCGILPVADEERLVGMITDRDIALRGVAKSKNPDRCTVQEIMTSGVKYLFDYETTDDLARNMRDLQIRRLPVVNREKRLVGIVSIGDLAAKSDGDSASAALRSVSRPASAQAPLAG